MVLNHTQQELLKQIVDVYIFDEELGNFDPRIAIIVLKSMIDNDTFNENRTILRQFNMIENVEFIRKIFSHKNPQNRCVSFLDDESQDSQIETITFRNFQGKIGTEQKGLLGLTCFNDETAEPVTKVDVVKFIQDRIELAMKGHLLRQRDFERCSIHGISFNCTEKVEELAPEMKKLVSEAKRGNSESQIKLGLAYLLGDGVPIDWSKASEYFLQSAKIGNPDAQALLAICFSEGFGVQICKTQEREWFIHSAEKGNKLALSKCLIYGWKMQKNFEKAFEYLSSLVDKGDVIAQHMIALYYQFIAKNETKAVKFYKKAARKNYFPSQFQLGLCYESGIGVIQDYKKSRALYQRSAAAGYYPSALQLAYLYYYGNGIEKNWERAFKIIKDSSNRGYMHSMYILGGFYERGIGTEIDLSKAHYWYNKAAELGSMDAQNALFRLQTRNPFHQYNY